MANRLPKDKQIAVVSMLAEGSSIRAIERITGINRNTIMNLGVRVGQGCAKIIWDGEVEVFDLSDSNRVYAWAYETDQVDQPKRTVTVLHILPVTSPELAVRAAIVKDYRDQQESH